MSTPLETTVALLRQAKTQMEATSLGNSAELEQGIVSDDEVQRAYGELCGMIRRLGGIADGTVDRFDRQDMDDAPVLRIAAIEGVH